MLEILTGSSTTVNPGTSMWTSAFAAKAKPQSRRIVLTSTRMDWANDSYSFFGSPDFAARAFHITFRGLFTNGGIMAEIATHTTERHSTHHQTQHAEANASKLPTVLLKPGEADRLIAGH